MRPLILFILISLAPAALAGGGGPSAIGWFPVQPGQVWELQAAPAGGRAFAVRHRVGKELLPRTSGGRAFEAPGSAVGGDISYRPSERGLSLTRFVGPATVFRCFAVLPEGAGQAEGILLSGSVEVTNEQLQRAQEGTDYSFRALIAQARAQGAGRCTLKRLR